MFMTPKRKVTPSEIEAALKNFDWEKFNARLLWSMNAPRCICCGDLYQSWLERGKTLYEGEMDAYQERVAREDAHRKNIQCGQEVSRNSRPVVYSTRMMASA